MPGCNEEALQQFVSQNPWNHEDLQLQLAHYLASQLKVKINALVLDDTSLPKKGHDSTGVARQY